MHKVIIFTPTQRPGLDVSLASVLRQETTAHIHWLIIDELYDERKDVVANLFPQYREKFNYTHIKIGKRDSDIRNLARAYNVALDFAINYGADMLVSLQDYIWAPPSGVQAFLDLDQYLGQKNIHTGICNISADPRPDTIHDKDGMLTIFSESYTDEPGEIAWIDPRQTSAPSDHHFATTTPMEWELNWAAISEAALHDNGLYFNEQYDQGVAYENQDYAYRAKERGYEIIIDHANKAISLPHKEYWPEEWNYEEPFTQKNKNLVEALWTTN